MHWLYRPDNRAKLWMAFAAMLAATVLAGFVVDMHPHFEFEGWPAFFAVFGFASCVVLVFVSKLLGALLKRPDSFYDR